MMVSRNRFCFERNIVQKVLYRNVVWYSDYSFLDKVFNLILQITVNFYYHRLCAVLLLFFPNYEKLTIVFRVNINLLGTVETVSRLATTKGNFLPEPCEHIFKYIFSSFDTLP